MKNAILKQFQKLEEKERELRARKEVLRQDILGELKNEGYDKMETDYGTFSVVYRRKYTYSDKVKELEQKVKVEKKKEEQQGIATEEMSEGLMYRPPKN